jgi:hypothetical protein
MLNIGLNGNVELLEFQENEKNTFFEIFSRKSKYKIVVTIPRILPNR